MGLRQPLNHACNPRKRRTNISFACAAFLMGTITLGEAQGPHMMQPRVPRAQLEEARVLTSPLAYSPEVVARGKMLYEGKGTCANCHGMNGNGRGPGAVNLNPAPRNFRHHGFWRHRTEGEIFWVIKHGSPGTAMIPFGGLLSDKEIWTIIQYERTFSRRSGPPGERGRRHGRGPMMPRSGPGHHRGGNEPCCGEP